MCFRFMWIWTFLIQSTETSVCPRYPARWLGCSSSWLMQSAARRCRVVSLFSCGAYCLRRCYGHFALAMVVVVILFLLWIFIQLLHVYTGIRKIFQSPKPHMFIMSTNQENMSFIIQIRHEEDGRRFNQIQL